MFAVYSHSTAALPSSLLQGRRRRYSSNKLSVARLVMLPPPRLCFSIAAVHAAAPPSSRRQPCRHGSAVVGQRHLHSSSAARHAPPSPPWFNYSLITLSPLQPSPPSFFSRSKRRRAASMPVKQRYLSLSHSSCSHSPFVTSAAPLPFFSVATVMTAAAPLATSSPLLQQPSSSSTGIPPPLRLTIVESSSSSPEFRPCS